MASTDPAHGRRGITAFLVSRGTAGFEVTRSEPTIARPPDQLAELTFIDCVVPPDAVLGEIGRGFYYAMENLNEGRLYVTSLAIGMAQAAQEDAIAYAQ
jgi:alkylation response protein AidB-like acyl-CoA dehydrogenase